ncbi:MAG: ANTAR domain-containing response regulator [Ignavibacteriales bacterium]
MARLRVVVADDEPIIRMDLRGLLEDGECEVLGEAGEGITLINLVRSLTPDVAVVDAKMPGMDGLEAARVLVNEGICAVLILTAYSREEMVSRAADYGVHGYLVKPVRGESLIPSLRVAIARFTELSTLRNKTRELAAKIEVRKSLERAKGIIMEEYGISEAEAHRRILKASMNSRKSVREIADAIILHSSCFGSDRGKAIGGL